MVVVKVVLSGRWERVMNRTMCLGVVLAPTKIAEVASRRVQSCVCRRTECVCVLAYPPDVYVFVSTHLFVAATEATATCRQQLDSKQQLLPHRRGVRMHTHTQRCCTGLVP